MELLYSNPVAHLLGICGNADPDLTGGHRCCFSSKLQGGALLRLGPGPDLEELGAEAPWVIPACGRSRQPVPALEILPRCARRCPPGQPDVLFHWSKSNILREGNVSPLQTMHLYKTK